MSFYDAIMAYKDQITMLGDTLLLEK
jgi:hypothetical protein